MRPRILLKSSLFMLVLILGMAIGAAAQDEGAACLNETTVSPELAEILGWPEDRIGLTLMDALMAAGEIRTYCFTSKADCEDSQKAASGGTKSGCYKNSDGKYCYDLQFSSTSATTESALSGPLGE